MIVQGDEAREILESLIQGLSKADDCKQRFASDAIVLIENNNQWETYAGWIRIRSAMAAMKKGHLGAEIKMCIQTGPECYAEVQLLTPNLTTTRRWVHFTSEGGRVMFLRIFGERSMNSRDE